MRPHRLAELLRSTSEITGSPSIVLTRPRPPALVAVAATAMLSSWSALGRAQTLEIAADVPLGGDQVYQEVIIDAEVSVPVYSPDDPESGWLRIYADRIVIGETGSISADGAGFNTTDLGTGPGGFNQPGNVNQPSPGGGGAHVGAGATGAWGEAPMMCPSQNGALCQIYAASPGGIPYEDPMNPLALTLPTAGMGSAGGRSWAGCPNDDANLPGGAGGGTILLYANQLDLRGRLSARGATPSPGVLTSPGGGAGGTIVMSVSASLSLGSGAEIRVDGADGIQGNAVGGGGGGGLIVVASPMDVTDLLMTDCPGASACTSVTGGSTAPCMEDAGAGARVSRSPLACPDADGDLFTNSGCTDPQATDCNDADPLINPDAEEICDGVDNDCDGSVDENPSELCDANLTCIDGTCQSTASGSGGGGGLPSAPAPPRVELSGGLCALQGPVGRQPRPAPPTWLAALAFVGLVTRRRRTSSPDAPR